MLENVISQTVQQNCTL